ncbi:MAG: hypothetical protein WBR21_08140 [Rouxiella badensis]|uniref:hypothetical protein n=1 Tax=Rouxiella badensis TaxID=1646377 RepID=UPI003C3A58FB
MSETAAEKSARAICTRITDAMAALRDYAPPGPETDADPVKVREELHVVRGLLDQAEVLFAEMSSVRADFRAKAAQRREQFQDRFDRELGKLTGRSVSAQYESGKEREAQARVKAVDELIVSRTADRCVVIVDGAYETVRIKYYGLLNIREELLNLLTRYLPWRASMEDPA